MLRALAIVLALSACQNATTRCHRLMERDRGSLADANGSGNPAVSDADVAALEASCVAAGTPDHDADMACILEGDPYDAVHGTNGHDHLPSPVLDGVTVPPRAYDGRGECNDGSVVRYRWQLGTDTFSFVTR
jgi:hypothetical protein|nr:hypothetical protein [Kofleriaceae bacterium]